jgi:hypothetical protein
MKTALQLQQRIVAFIGGAADRFDSLAREVFAFQFEQNVAYRAFCERKNRTPENLADWRDIPAVPTSAFKETTVACFPVADAVAEFHTSGTTKVNTGRHLFRTLELYDAAITPNFAAHLFPEGARMTVLSLVPDDPRSSLSHMARVLIREFGGAFIEKLAPVNEPVCVLGTAFHFLSLFDGGLSLRLPPGSRVMETGGFKGRTRDVTKPELYAMFEKHLGVPATHVVNEYGMTELSTQFYDDTLCVGGRSDLKHAPPWARVRVMDPQTGEKAAPGVPGLLRVYDLANLWSAMCVQTEDVGAQNGDGFILHGRARGAMPRGCSLNAEAMTEA